MGIKKLSSFIFVMLLGCTALAPLAKANDTNEEIEVTFNHPVEIPGQVLPAGTYRFVLMGDTFSRNLVRIWSPDRKKLYATLGTVETHRAQPTDAIMVTFAERDSSAPEALLSWFYPAMSTGREFLYPKQEEKELARDQQQVVTAGPMGSQVRNGF